MKELSRKKKSESEVKTYKTGEGKLLSNKKELKLNKLEPYMIKTGVLTGVYLVPTDLAKYKPKSISKEAREKMSKAEKELLKKQKQDYKDLLENAKRNSYLEIKQDWLELCIYMLGTIYSNNKDTFLSVLLKHNVMSPGFTVTTNLVDYAKGEGYKRSYKIPCSNFYLETNLDSIAVCKAIKAMASALNITEDRELLFDIAAKDGDGDGDGQEIKLREGIASDIYTEMSLVEAMANQNKRLNIVGITISGERTYVSSNTECLSVFLSVMYKIYKKKLIDACVKHEVVGVVGISTEKSYSNVSYRPVKYARRQCYSNGDSFEMINYMNKVLTEIGYMPMLVNLTIREIGFKQTN